MFFRPVAEFSHSQTSALVAHRRSAKTIVEWRHPAQPWHFSLRTSPVDANPGPTLGFGQLPNQ
jgi:hypothetical protein